MSKNKGPKPGKPKKRPRAKNSNNTAQSQPAVFCVTGDFDFIAQDVLTVGKEHITNSATSAEIMRVHGTTIVGNPQGGRLFDTLTYLKTEFHGLKDRVSCLEEGNTILKADNKTLKEDNLVLRKDNAVLKDDNTVLKMDNRNSKADNIVLKEKSATHDARITTLENSNRELFILKDLFLSVRERAFTTYLRNFWRDYGATKAARQQAQAHDEVRDTIQRLNRSIIHGGFAIADAVMMTERRPETEYVQFEHVYGLRPPEIKEIAKKGCKSILNLLNAAGGYHLEGIHLNKSENKIFLQVIRLVKENQHAEAEKLSKTFPFEKGHLELDVFTFD